MLLLWPSMEPLIEVPCAKTVSPSSRSFTDPRAECCAHNYFNTPQAVLQHIEKSLEASIIGLHSYSAVTTIWCVCSFPTNWSLLVTLYIVHSLQWQIQQLGVVWLHLETGIIFGDKSELKCQVNILKSCCCIPHAPPPWSAHGLIFLVGFLGIWPLTCK